MRLSVLIPAHNEAATLGEVIRRVRATGLAAEMVVVDDGSTDGTARVLDSLPEGVPPVTRLAHATRCGKGTAVRTGLRAVTGDLVLVQDADLEYDPSEYSALLAPFSDPAVQAVFGSRNLQPNPRSNLAFYWGGRLLSAWANALYGAHLTDITTGYKVVRADVLRSLPLAADGFEFCEELTALLLRRGGRIVEVPIHYAPRSRAAGKKIRARDGAIAFWTLWRLRRA